MNVANLQLEGLLVVLSELANLLAEGDPMFYSSYMHMHTRLTERFHAVIVPGVTSVSAASAAISTRSSLNVDLVM
mgnify:CR=1 FL=1